MDRGTFIEPDWPAPPGVCALVTTRSAGEHSSLQARLPQLPAEPRWLHQVHGVGVADLDAPLAADAQLQADASFTTRPGVVSVVRTADCLPVLFAATDGSVVAAAHAGWRGLAAGVLEATLAAMRGRMSRALPLRAWLGPAIGPGHFEVGEEVRAAFLAADTGADTAFAPGRADRWMCDLYALARRRLAASGVSEVYGGGLCTYDDEESFHSYRRDVQHRGMAGTGRMATLVWRQP